MINIGDNNKINDSNIGVNNKKEIKDKNNKKLSIIIDIVIGIVIAIVSAGIIKLLKWN